MAGYPKIWTTIRHEAWFKELSCIQRSIWLQAILIAKEQTDDGWLCFNNATHFASETHTNRTNIDTWIARETQGERINIARSDKRLLRFFITNYNSSQQVKVYIPDKKLPTSRAYKQSKEASKGKEGKSATFTKSKFRSKAQKWNDGQYDLINEKFQELWGREPDIKTEMALWLKKAQKSAGLVIVGLQRAKTYEKKSGETIKDMTAWICSDFQRRNYWTDTDLAKVKQIDLDYEADFKTKVDAVSIGDIMNRETLK